MITREKGDIGTLRIGVVSLLCHVRKTIHLGGTVLNTLDKNKTDVRSTINNDCLKFTFPFHVKLCLKERGYMVAWFYVRETHWQTSLTNVIISLPQ